MMRREEYLLAVQLLNAEHKSLTVHAGKRQLKLKPTDWVHYQGKRASRGHRLPRGMQGVTGLTVE